MTDLYQQRGVSAEKHDVVYATKSIDKGLYPSAFCKVIKDVYSGDPDYAVVMHADGAGTKSSLAYLYFKETGDYNAFAGISKDSIIMNIDDMLCVGAYKNMVFSSTIGRNSKLIDAKAVKTIIETNESYLEHLRSLGVGVVSSGGETADVGDLVKTLIVDATVGARMKRKDIIKNDAIKEGDIIIGLASYGKTTYEDTYNSGIGSNGLTAARHELLTHDYYTTYPVTYDNSLAENIVYQGPFKVTDPLEDTELNIGQAILSPTRTYAPIIMDLLRTNRSLVSGLVHCSGGGQTKCMNFGNNIKYIKNNLFDIPPLFELIKQHGQIKLKEMFKVFNMGHRMEIYGSKELLPVVQKIGDKYQIDVKQIGYCEKSDGKNRVEITYQDEKMEYSK